MSGFTADWLALREPADHAARNRDVLAEVARSVAGQTSLDIVDLGCGTGSNLRGCSLDLPVREQHWTLVDADPALLRVARERLAGWADQAEADGDRLLLRKAGRTITVACRPADLASGLGDVVPSATGLVTAAALFDLVSPDWIGDVARFLAARRLPFYAVLTYNGREAWLPRHEADEAILRAFASHQHRDKAFGPAAGPEAAAVLERSLAAVNYKITAGDSSWRLGVPDAELMRQLAEGIASAASETGDVPGDVVDEWLAFRLGNAGSPDARATIGHTDLFAKPGA